MEIERRLSPIPSRVLVEDILEDIFFRLSPEQPFTEAVFLDVQVPEMTLLSILHVCRHWRSVALSSPRLWTTILFNSNASLAMVQEFLIRSAQMSLQICLITDSMPVNRVPQAFELLLPHIYWIKTFMLSVCRSTLGTAPLTNFLSRLLSSALRLENLKLLTSGSIDITITSQTPLLRTMICMGISHLQIPSISCGLTTLRVQIVTPLSIQEIVDAIRHCRTLERLTLAFQVHILPTDATDHPHPTTRTELTHLQQLSVFTVKEVDVSYLLPHLVFPDTAILHLAMCLRNRSILFPPCAQVQHHISSLKTVVLKRYQGVPIDFNSKTIIGHSATTRDKLHLGWVWRKSHPPTHRAIAFHLCDFSALLHLVVKTAMSYQEWTALFAGAPNLGRLRLMPSGFLTVPEEAGHHHTLVAALTNERPEDHTLFCPQLVFLSVNAAPLKEQWLVQQLATCCMVRSEHGVPITSLTIWFEEGEQLLAESLALLECAVSVVQCRRLPHDWTTSRVHWEV